ncbi:hypothetical protein V6Z11_A10G006100 [Gossypium hirsutum]
MAVQVQGSVLGNTSILLCLSKAPSPPFPMLIPLRLHKAKRCCFVAAHSTSSTKAAPLSCNHRESGRPLANFPPDIWGDRFLTLSFDISELNRCSRQVEVLKETVKDMLMASTTDPLHNVLLINSLCRLGVSYHFETEIEQQLTHCFDELSKLIHNDDIFNKFKDENGKFKVSDTKELISLYEASHFRINGELKSMVSRTSPHYAQYIKNALYCPYQRGVPRLEARQYICFYEKDDGDEARNDTLLKFAKYDLNRIQMMLQQELSNLCSEWKEENMESRLPYARNRIVECFFSAIAVYFEPCYARACNIYAKLLSTLVLNDDTYDAYSTYEELQYFTDAIQSYMKQYGVTRQEAVEAYREMIEVAWKDMNEACLKPMPVSNKIAVRALNVARLVLVLYKKDDGFTRPELSLKDAIAKLLIHPIPL